MKTIFVVEQGCYSDYRVVGVFSTEEKAKQIAALLNKPEYCDEATVAEWPFDPHVDEINQGLFPFAVLMSYDGTVERCHRSEIESYSLPDGMRVWDRATAPFYKGKKVDNAVNGSVWAKDSMHAIKIVNEFRVSAIASGELTKEGK